jgi:hypothetical protein
VTKDEIAIVISQTYMVLYSQEAYTYLSNSAEYELDSFDTAAAKNEAIKNSIWAIGRSHMMEKVLPSFHNDNDQTFLFSNLIRIKTKNNNNNSGVSLFSRL